MRQLAAWQEAKAELEGLEASIYAVSTDNLEQATEVAGKGLTFPVAYGATKRTGRRSAPGGPRTMTAISSPPSFCWAGAAWSWGPCTPPGRWAAWAPTRRCGPSPPGNGGGWNKNSNERSLGVSSNWPVIPVLNRNLSALSSIMTWWRVLVSASGGRLSPE